MSQSLNTQQEKEELQRRIRGLTSMLHRFAVQKGPSKRPRVAPTFLRYFVTLLTCSEEDDTDAKRIIAATVSTGAGQQVQTLIVAQDPHAPSSASPLFMKVVQKPNRSLDEVVAGPSHLRLIDHIADTWAALSAVDRRATNYAEQLASLEIFFLRRNFRKFSVRFRQDTRLCGGKRLAELIGQWKPTDRPEITLKWVTPPAWLLQLKDLAKIKSRMARGHIEWEFSDETKRDWSTMLVAVLSAVDKSIENVKQARDMGEENPHEEMETLSFWCRVLYYFVTWEAGIVKDLLTKTDMVERIFMPMRTDNTTDDFDDESAELLLPELGESNGVQVLRYLCSVIAWHASVNTLIDNEALPEFLKSIEIALAQMPRSPSSVLTLQEISDEFFIQFPSMMSKRQVVLETLKSRHSDIFFDFVHPEAALMGLMNHYRRYSAQAGQDVGFWDAQRMQQIVQPVAEAGIAVIELTQKCCWCCDWLSYHLESGFVLPGTHGVVYPWDPPKVGVSESVLKKLEEELWIQLRTAVLMSIKQSSASSTNRSPGFYIPTLKPLRMPQLLFGE